MYPDGELVEAAELGAVDFDRVRVWLRQPNVAQVTARLEVSGQAPVSATTTLSAETDWTGSITLMPAEPAPDQPFTCWVAGRRLSGRFSPRPGTHTGLSFGFGSCHLPFQEEPGGSVGVRKAIRSYTAMYQRLEREQARFLLLCGDQIYSGNPEPLSIWQEFQRESDDPPRFAQALAAYRRHYRGFFQTPAYRALRERFPTYCIWDDHETMAGWGSLLSVNATEQRLFEASQRAYCEYEQLRNPNGAIGPPPYHYHFQHGDAGFFVLDLRGERDYRRHRLLGEKQWAALDAYLEAAEDRIQTLFLVASVPIAHVSRWAVDAGQWIHETLAAKLRDRWCSAAFVADRDRLLRRLFSWQTAMPRRQVILLSGDVHAAGAYTVEQRDGPGLIWQFTSSALSHPLRGVELLLNRTAVHLPNLFEPDFHFQRRFLVYENNLGLVRMTPLAEGGHRVEFRVEAWYPREQRLRTAARIVSLPESPSTAARQPAGQGAAVQ